MDSGSAGVETAVPTSSGVHKNGRASWPSVRRGGATRFRARVMRPAVEASWLLACEGAGPVSCSQMTGLEASLMA